MDTSILTSQLVVLGFTGVIVAYWWYVLVPGARVNLAVNKRSGRLRDYLEELKGDDSRKMERFFYQKWLAKVDPETRFLLRDDGDEDGDGRVVEAKTRLSDARPHRRARCEGRWATAPTAGMRTATATGMAQGGVTCRHQTTCRSDGGDMTRANVYR